MSTTIDAFWEHARRDAAVQERLRVAYEAGDPLSAVVAVARDAGFAITNEALLASLTSELSDKELDAVAGGADVRSLLLQSHSFRAPGEWFAEA